MVLVDVTVGAVSDPSQPPAGQPNSSWTRAQIIAWLQANGVTMTAAALEQMSKAELLDLVDDLTDDEQD